MTIRKRAAVAVIAAGVLGSIAMAAPANASINQSGCKATSLKIYTDSTGYCFNGLGSTHVGLGGVVNLYTGAYAGAFSYQTFGSNPGTIFFNFGQNYDPGNGYFTVIDLSNTAGPTS